MFFFLDYDRTQQLRINEEAVIFESSCNSNSEQNDRTEMHNLGMRNFQCMVCCFLMESIFTDDISHTPRDIQNAYVDSPVDDSDLDSHYVPSDSADNTSETGADNEDTEEDTYIDEEMLINIGNGNNNNAVETEKEGAVKSRKRKRNERNWKCNVRKVKRAAGQAYVSKNRRVIQEKKLKRKCKETCRLKCSVNFTEENRSDIFKHFWSASMDNNKKRQFVASCVTQEEVQRRHDRTGQKQRNTTLHYHFFKDHKRVRICKTFFLNTLSISQTFVETSLSKRLPAGGAVLEDLRGKNTPKNKISEDIRNKIREHILKFPAQESHYRREKSSKKYLESNLSIKKMYELYVSDCREQNVPFEQIAKLWLYTEIFNTEFNYSFKNPVNDTCDECDYFQVQLRNMVSNEEK